MKKVAVPSTIAQKHKGENMETVIFYIDKVTDEFKSCQIIKNKTGEEIIAAAAQYNSEEEGKIKQII